MHTTHKVLTLHWLRLQKSCRVGIGTCHTPRPSAPWEMLTLQLLCYTCHNEWTTINVFLFSKQHRLFQFRSLSPVSFFSPRSPSSGTSGL